MFTLEAFIADIDKFCETNGMAESRFGREAVKDPSFVSEIRNKKRAPTTGTVEKIYRFMKGFRRTVEASDVL